MFVFQFNISMNEHVGTHMDAPYHFYSKGWTTDQIPLDHLVNVPGVVVDISHKAATDVEAKLEEEDLEAWVADNGDFPDRCLVLMRLANNSYVEDSDSDRNNFPDLVGANTITLIPLSSWELTRVT